MSERERERERENERKDFLTIELKAGSKVIKTNIIITKKTKYI